MKLLLCFLISLTSLTASTQDKLDCQDNAVAAAIAIADIYSNGFEFDHDSTGHGISSVDFEPSEQSHNRKKYQVTVINKSINETTGFEVLLYDAKFDPKGKPSMACSIISIEGV